MAGYFFDASAIVKRYLIEVGTLWVGGLVSPSAGNRIYVARISGAEVVAAISRRGKAGALAPATVIGSIAQFRLDFTGQYLHVPVSSSVVRKAMDLAEKHALRGYDAVQLACALAANARRLSKGALPLALISADVDLNAAAAAEGMVVDDPNHHP